MADPLSIGGVAIAVVTAALQSANVLSEIIKSIKDGPKEISGIRRDLEAFQNLVFSLETALEDGGIQRRIIQDTTLEALVGNLKIRSWTIQSRWKSSRGNYCLTSSKLTVVAGTDSRNEALPSGPH